MHKHGLVSAGGPPICQCAIWLHQGDHSGARLAKGQGGIARHVCDQASSFKCSPDSSGGGQVHGLRCGGPLRRAPRLLDRRTTSSMHFWSWTMERLQKGYLL